MPPYFEDFFLPFFFAGTYFFTRPKSFNLTQDAFALETVSVNSRGSRNTEDWLRRTESRFQNAEVK